MITSFKQIEKLSGLKLTQPIGFGKKYRGRYLWELPWDYLHYMESIGACIAATVVARAKEAKEIHDKLQIKKAEKVALPLFNPVNISDYILNDADKVKRNAAQVRELMRFNGKSNIMINGCIGSGKTILAIEMMKLYAADKTLVVCPLSVFSSWQDKLKKFYPEKSVNVLTGKIENRVIELSAIKSDIYITNPESIRNESFLIALCNKGFSFSFFDESHLYLSNHSSDTCKNIKILIESIKHNYLMTGSFITDGREWKAVDQLHTLGIFDHPISTVYKTYFDLNSYYKPESVKLGMSENLLEIFSKNSMTILEHELELPEPIFEEREILITGDCLEAYNRAIKDSIINIDNHEIDIPAKIAEITRLRQITGGTMLIKDDDGNVIKRHRYKNNNKTNEVHNIVSEFRDNDKFIIVCQYTEEIELLLKEFKGAAVIRGGQSAEHRKKNLSNFIDGAVRTLIMQIDAGGVGIDGLQDVCRYIIFYSNTYSFEKFRQCYGRLYRSGVMTNIVVYMIHGVLEKGWSIDVIMNEVRQLKNENRDDCLGYIYEKMFLGMYENACRTAFDKG